VSEVRRTVRALPTLFRVGFASAVAYRSEFLIWVLTTNMPLVMLLLWTAVAREAPVGRFGEQEFAAYFLAALIVRLVTGSWVVWEMNMEIRDGTLAMRLLRPVHPFIAYATENLAALPMRLLVSLPIAFGALLWVGHEQLTHDPVQWAIAPLSLAGAWTITFCVMLAIGTLGLFWQSSLALFDLWLAVSFVFSGYTIPLELFPSWLYAIARWLPFRYTLSFPVENLLGLASRHDSLQALAIQWGYAAAFLLLALRLWRAGVARYAAFGG
jgi:ABC-2 type transport system permease protein